MAAGTKENAPVLTLRQVDTKERKDAEGKSGIRARIRLDVGRSSARDRKQRRPQRSCREALVLAGPWARLAGRAQGRTGFRVHPARLTCSRSRLNYFRTGLEPGLEGHVDSSTGPALPPSAGTFQGVITPCDHAFLLFRPSGSKSGAAASETKRAPAGRRSHSD